MSGVASARPRVSLGVPIYNGERYLEEALESLLSQDFEDFELILSDNASEDGTERICRAFCARDSRVTYVRNAENIGAVANFNRVLELASGELFKWAAHDDVCLPGYLRSCVDALDADSGAVLCDVATARIDEEGERVFEYDRRHELASESPKVRFRSIMNGYCMPIFGLIRREILAAIGGLATFPGADRILLVELGLKGPFCVVDEVLFLHREHPARYARSFGRDEWRKRVAWFAPQNVGDVKFTTWTKAREAGKAIAAADLGTVEKASCYVPLAAWTLRRSKVILVESTRALRRPVS